MARERRIEYPGAIYHAMARGDRREDIVHDDADRRRFVGTLGEVVERSGWVMFAWVLMNNHYHLLFKTPEPNLVEGMKWFQNTWTRRFNARHRLWGHLFGGRYKAKPVEEGDYLTRLIHYIHLNPVRAGLVTRRRGLESYPWCSLAEFIKPPRKRCGWVAADRALRHMALPDTAAGRRRFLEWTEKCVDWRHPGGAGAAMPEGRSLQSTLRRGWYFGTGEFREKLLKHLASEPVDLREERRKGFSREQTRDHGIGEAGRIIRLAGQALGLAPDGWSALNKGDWRKGVVAGLIRERALVDNGWLAEHLHMEARNAVSRIIRQGREQLKKDRKARQLEKHVRTMSNCFD